MQYFTVRVDKILCLNYLGNKPVGWVVLKCKKDNDLWDLKVYSSKYWYDD